ncbi:MAG: NAD-dependent epimerase/dehydratase family protein [Candidatus Micrarchaeota archaeon]
MAKKILVTGGAGFIGSHLCDALLKQKKEVLVVDNLCSGKLENLNTERVSVLKGDILDSELMLEATRGISTVFHYAADPLVKESAERPREHFRTNIEGTLSVLEACRKNSVKQVVFASTSTVYGEAKILPTPEDYPTIPISNYGASKLCCEALLSSYAHTYGMKCLALRYANIFGPRSSHGVMFDFFKKLRANPKKLEMLGNGLQKKSYLYIDDCVSATLLAHSKQRASFGSSPKAQFGRRPVQMRIGTSVVPIAPRICPDGQIARAPFEFYNIGSDEARTVNEIADFVGAALKLKSKPAYSYTGGERGWVGDVRAMLLDCSKIKKLGWKPKNSLKEGVEKYISWLASSTP